MRNKIENIKKRLDSPISGGRIELESGLIILKKNSNEYEIYHNSFVRGGTYPICTIQNDEEFLHILKLDQKYMEARKELEEKGYKPMGRGLYFLKSKDGNVIRNENNQIIEATLRWGE